MPVKRFLKHDPSVRELHNCFACQPRHSARNGYLRCLVWAGGRLTCSAVASRLWLLAVLRSMSWPFWHATGVKLANRCWRRFLAAALAHAQFLEASMWPCPPPPPPQNHQRLRSGAGHLARCGWLHGGCCPSELDVLVCRCVCFARSCVLGIGAVAVLSVCGCFRLSLRPVGRQEGCGSYA